MRSVSQTHLPMKPFLPLGRESDPSWGQPKPLPIGTTQSLETSNSRGMRPGSCPTPPHLPLPREASGKGLLPRARLWTLLQRQPL